MGAALPILLLFGGIALIIGLFCLGAHVLETRNKGLAIRKQRVRLLEQVLTDVDQLARDNLAVNPGDITALQVAGAVVKARRAL